jgi:probable HAF family extracellular repeat protein
MYSVDELKGPSNTDTQVYGINANGQMAGIAFEPSLIGAIWYGGAYAGPFFSMAVGTESCLYRINDVGDAVGVEGSNNSPTQKAVLVRGGVVTDLSPHIGAGTIATDINNLGRICGWGWNAPGSFVFDSWANTTSAEIPPLPGDKHAVATAINQAGDVVGLSGDTHGFVYSGGTLRDLGQAGGPVAFVDDINESGQVCGSIGKPWPQAFSPGIWDISQTVPTFTEIPVPAGFLGGHAEGINNKGDVVGTCWTPQTYDLDPTAYIYSGGVSTDLNTLVPAVYGWHLQFAEAINDYGQITGIGRVNGQQRGFLLTPLSSGSQQNPQWNVPLPMLVAVLILGGVRVGGGGWEILPGGPPVPVGPWGTAWATLPAAKRDALVGLALDELAQHIEDASAREAIRRPILEGVRRQVDRLLETPQAGATMMRPRTQALGLQSAKLPSARARFGRRSQQQQ